MTFFLPRVCPSQNTMLPRASGNPKDSAARAAPPPSEVIAGLYGPFQQNWCRPAAAAAIVDPRDGLEFWPGGVIRPRRVFIFGLILKVF